MIAARLAEQIRRGFAPRASASALGFGLPGVTAVVLALATLLMLPSAAHSQPDDAADEAPTDPVPADDDQLVSRGVVNKRIAVVEFDALGLEDELVARLESLFRNELARLSSHPLPTPRAVEAARRSSRALARCAGADRCLAALGRKLDVDAVVSGNVAALGDSYVINIKVTDARTAEQLARISSDPLRGTPDELIEAVRVAAYRLLAPDQLLGSLTVISDLVGAQVYVDGKAEGATPLPGPIYKLTLGEHVLRVEAEGYRPFEQKVVVRFQKSTRVVVRLATVADGPTDPLGAVAPPRPARRPWYSSPWFYVTVGVAAGIAGAVAGYVLAADDVIDCNAMPRPMQCGLGSPR